MRDESVRVSTIAATAMMVALIPMQSAHSRATFRSRMTTCAGRRLVSRKVQVQPTMSIQGIVATQRSLLQVFGHMKACVCQRGIYRGQTHAMVYRLDVAIGCRRPWMAHGSIWDRRCCKFWFCLVRTPIFLLWRSRGTIGRVRTTPGALPTAAASMDGSDGRPDGRPGGGKGVKKTIKYHTSHNHTTRSHTAVTYPHA